ncbi:transposase IS66 family domain protein, partial [Escherichia coli 10.0869]
MLPEPETILNIISLSASGPPLSPVSNNPESKLLLPPGFAPIFPDICYHLTHYKPAAADIPV